jgi:hypothetical protein
VDSRAGLDATETIIISGPCRESNPGGPACRLVAIRSYPVCPVRISAGTQNILTEVSREFSQSSETNAWMEP